MSNKIVIAKPGYNALTEVDPNNLVFSSDYNTLKYYASGNVTIEYVDNNTLYVTEVAHNLGYIPFFVAYVPTLGSSTLHAVVPDNRQSVAGRHYLNVYADTTKLYFAAQRNQGSGETLSKTFYYKIFKNNLGY